MEEEGDGKDGHFVVLKYCRTEFLLDVADTVGIMSVCD